MHRGLVAAVSLAACTAAVPPATTDVTFISHIMIEGAPPVMPAVTGTLSPVAKRGSYALVYPDHTVVTGVPDGLPFTVLADEKVLFLLLEPILADRGRVDLMVRRGKDYAVIPVFARAEGRRHVEVDPRATWREVAVALQDARVLGDEVSLSRVQVK